MATNLGTPVEGWSPPPGPTCDPLEGRYVRLEALRVADHAEPLFKAFGPDDAIWDYMPNGPFHTPDDLTGWMTMAETSEDPLFRAIFNKDSGAFEGFLSFLRIAPEAGSIEVGWIAMSPALQRTRAATEAVYLTMKWAFQAGYRRFEWKCNALNLPSRRAAQRYGLSYEGIFRQATVSKGRNRDTAWFAAIDSEWPALERAFEAWLQPENFDQDGQQVSALSKATRPILVSTDPGL